MPIIPYHPILFHLSQPPAPIPSHLVLCSQVDPQLQSVVLSIRNRHLGMHDASASCHQLNTPTTPCEHMQNHTLSHTTPFRHALLSLLPYFLFFLSLFVPLSGGCHVDSSTKQLVDPVERVWVGVTWRSPDQMVPLWPSKSS